MKKDYTLSRKDVADRLGVTPLQVWRYTQKNYLTTTQYVPHGKRYYSASEVNAFKQGKMNDNL